MRIKADLDLCQGHGMCEDAAPTVFRVVESSDGSYDHVDVLLPEPDAGLREQVEEAVKYCPNRALSLLLVLITAVAALGSLACDAGPGSGAALRIDKSGPAAGWSQVGGDVQGQRFSANTQINRENVRHLEEAWRFESGDVTPTTSLQVTPILVDDQLIFCTPRSQVVSIDAESGAERWRFDAQPDLTGIYNPLCRGVAQAKVEPARSPSLAADKIPAAANHTCTTRIYVGTLDARLIALDAATGKPCQDFGEGGTVNLLDGIGETRAAEYYMTSPPVVSNGIVVNGAWVTDGQRVDAPGGVIRGWDARTGKLVWAWDPVPEDATPVTAQDVAKGETYTRGTANAWSLLSADESLGLVYLPMGNAAPDHYGGERNGLGRYASAVVALDIRTGELRWDFKTVYHDVWDYDVASQPVLYTHPGGASGEGIPALAQATKMGHVFLLDRRTGEPLFPVEMRPVPQSGVTGEVIAAEQPFPTLPPPLHPHALPPEDVWGLTPIDRAQCRKLVASLRNDGIFTPPSREGAIVFPGLGGGVNWGSLSVDDASGRLIVNSMRNPFIVQAVPRAEAGSLEGTDLVGAQPQEGTPFVTIRAPLLSDWGMPCTPPPWGQLTSIDLASGKIEWQRPLGNLRELAPAFGRFFEWGTPNQGGPIQTAGGVSFIGATMDRTFRAFDTETGEELWSTLLPTSAHATPMTYRVGVEGRQFVVIAAGGHAPLGSPSDDVLIAYALPK
ncbi:MAG: PQQ-binding-like beta-propeller repeat protein [Myxococcota bacterium]